MAALGKGHRGSYGNTITAVCCESNETDERNRMVQRNETGIWNRKEVISMGSEGV